MDKMLCLVVFAAVLSLSAAQSLKCETPKDWEGRLFETTGYGDRFAKISYDETYNRTRIIEEVFIEDKKERDYFDELYLYREGVFYRYNLVTKVCEKKPLRGDFRPVGVPGGSHFVGEAYIGSSAIPNAGVLVIGFEEETDRGFYAGEWIPMDHNCLPVSDFFFSHNGRQQQVIHWSFLDITAGIKDPNVFVPPEACRGL